MVSQVRGEDEREHPLGMTVSGSKPLRCISSKSYRAFSGCSPFSNALMNVLGPRPKVQSRCTIYVWHRRCDLNVGAHAPLCVMHVHAIIILCGIHILNSLQERTQTYYVRVLHSLTRSCVEILLRPTSVYTEGSI